MNPVIDANSKCCMCNRIPDMWCQISNVNGEKGFMAWYCFEHLYQKLNQYAKLINKTFLNNKGRINDEIPNRDEVKQ